MFGVARKLREAGVIRQQTVVLDPEALGLEADDFDVIFAFPWPGEEIVVAPVSEPQEQIMATPSVQQIFQDLQESLDLEALTPLPDDPIPILAADVHRPGMAVMGFTENFLADRIQFREELSSLTYDEFAGRVRRRRSSTARATESWRTTRWACRTTCRSRSRVRWTNCTASVTATASARPNVSAQSRSTTCGASPPRSCRQTHWPFPSCYRN